MKTNKKGISLIVLVITILVMIIIAAAIILYLDDEKVISNAKRAVTENDIQVAKEILVVARTEWRTKNDKIREEGYATLQAYGEHKLEEAGYEIGYGVGKVIVLEDGLLYPYKTPVIPEGFVVSSVSTENKLTEGLVIYEGTEPVTNENIEVAQTTRDQYVWIPVPNITEFVRRDGYDEGVLQTRVSSGSTTEPYSYDNLITATNDLTGEYAEYTKMRASVEKYGGFYIARYEAGTSSKRFNGFVYTDDVLSQKNKYPYNYVGWAPSKTSTTGNIIDEEGRNFGKGSVELARNIYPENSNKNIVSTLCYGVQWDAVMSFMKNVENPYVEGKKYIEDSTGMGWYRDNSENNTESITGKDVDLNQSNMVKNIYDMAGNLRERTMEAASDVRRVDRGGHSSYLGNAHPASCRSHYPIEFAGEVFGFRVALYLK